MKRVRFDDDAFRELQEAFRFYDDKSQRLGDRWLQAMEIICKKIRNNPNSGRIAPHGMRLHPVSGFPYHVIFENQSDAVFIFAVMHVRREPDYWVTRLPPT